jgi:acetyltransferase-like isoleucine patch superfamily enzyme
MKKFDTSDINGFIFKKIRFYKLKILCLYSNWVNKTMLSLKKIKYGKNCRFYGIAYFFRHQGSRILIGENTAFRSDKTSNLIGINRKCIIATHSKSALIEIGKNSGFSGVTIGAFEKVIIGNNLLCGANVIISDFDWHNIDPLSRLETCISSLPVIIEDNVFIGVNSIIWKGVTIGENSVIGANSVVTKSIPSNVIAAGNPCRVIKSLNSLSFTIAGSAPAGTHNSAKS